MADQGFVFLFLLVEALFAPMSIWRHLALSSISMLKVAATVGESTFEEVETGCCCGTH